MGDIHGYGRPPWLKFGIDLRVTVDFGEVRRELTAAVTLREKCTRRSRRLIDTAPLPGPFCTPPLLVRRPTRDARLEGLVNT